MELVQKMLASVSEPAAGKGVVEVLIDAVVGMEWTENEGQKVGSQARTVAGVRTKLSGVVSASSVVICLGPWSGNMLIKCVFCAWLCGLRSFGSPPCACRRDGGRLVRPATAHGRREVHIFGV